MPRSLMAVRWPLPHTSYLALPPLHTQVPLPHGCPLLLDVLLARRSPSPDPRVTRRRSVLHVQSISSWAPSCIGPYSQVGDV